jgi:RNA polymerase sigma factor (TIGR02999 family)
MGDRPELTRLLRDAADDPAAAQAILPQVYDELRRLARAQMQKEGAGLTLQPTALVHEAWLRMLGSEGEALAWESRAHFFGAAAQAMRRILVERARRVGRERHGGHLRRQPLDGLEAGDGAELDDLDLEALDVALAALARRDPQAARLVELRFFGGLAVEDAARALGISERTAAREWNVARAWLAKEMRGAG